MAKLIKLWVLGSAACVSAGWILSLLHQLNWRGYTIFFLGLFLILAIEYELRHRLKRPGELVAPLHWRPRRFRRALPMLFLATATLAAVGGAVHAPNNYDALTYRFPRMLHWWSACTWHWIDTPNLRMNLSGTGFEWLMMPIFVLTHSDRYFFLINIAAYLLLPSLIFLVFLRAGVGRRAAWFWMWVFPAALCYAMQAGSFSNDTIAVTYFLAALYFAIEARRTSSVRNVWVAFLAAGLLTGVKASNLPLCLPLAWALWPVLPLLRLRPIASALALLMTALVSFLPMAALNWHYTGSWGGDPANLEKVQIRQPLAGILGNGLELGLQNLEPPFLPLARTAETWVWNRIPAAAQTVLRNGYPRFVVGFREIPQEESAGLGCIITLMALISMGSAWSGRKTLPFGAHRSARREGLILGGLTWLALLVYMCKLGSEAVSRLIAAYYPLLLLPLLLNRRQDQLVRRVWFRCLGGAALVTALLAVILTPSRPLWPAQTFFAWATQRHPNSEFLARAQIVYAVYQTRNDLFVSLRKAIPAGVRKVGVIEGIDDNAETSLWRPFGSREVVQIWHGNEPLETNLQWLIVKDSAVGDGKPGAFDEWLQSHRARLVDRETVTEKAGNGPENWSLVHLTGAAN
jgi:hypothetical protein